jgi:hypothetical protein
MSAESTRDHGVDHAHLELNREFEFISGSYSLTEEGRLPYRGREVLYMVGVAILDRTCCGSGGCRFLNVPGYLLDWRYRTDGEGKPVSRVEPILDAAERSEIRRLLECDFPHSQVNFIP